VRARHSIAERPDQAVRIAFLAAWLIGVVAIFGANATEALLVLLAPSGLLIAACGIVMARNWRGARDRLSARYKDSWQFRWSGKSHFTAFEGAALTVVGLIWLAMGAVQVVKRIS
jgi:hypothetical protein